MEPKTIEDIERQLKEPFPASAVMWKPQVIKKDKTAALAVAYIDARDVADRLDAVVGIFGWQRIHPNGNKDVAGVGIKNPETGEWIWKYDAGFIGGEDSTDADAQTKGIKGTASDGFKRAAALWGVGRYLYSLPKVWVDWDEQGRKFKTTPTLPDWARPAQEKTGTNPHPHGNTSGQVGNGRKPEPMSAVQRAKLLELYQSIYITEEKDALKKLDAMFFEQFGHGGKDATYEEAAKLTAELLALQKTQLAKPGTGTPARGSRKG